MFDLIEEQKYFSGGYKLVAGLDEVGRGPLAGPVVAACVAIGAGQVIDQELLQKVKDSKKLNHKKREYLSELLLKNIANISVGFCDNLLIDKINILEASFLAMKKAISDLKIKPDYLLVDGSNKIKNISIPQTTIVRGDSSVFAIAAASIVAKVYRDKLMDEYHQLYPNYGFDKHKGYGTKLHLERLKIFGACPIHRTSFAPVRAVIKL